MGNGHKGWVIRWEWMGDHAAVEQPFISVLSPRLGHQEVARFIQRYYAAKTFTPSEQVEYMLRKTRPFPFPVNFARTTIQYPDGRTLSGPWTGAMACGDNPYIVARLATNVHVEYPDGGTRGVLVWQDLPLPIHDLARPSKPLGQEPEVVVELPGDGPGKASFRLLLDVLVQGHRESAGRTRPRPPSATERWSSKSRSIPMSAGITIRRRRQ